MNNELVEKQRWLSVGRNLGRNVETTVFKSYDFQIILSTVKLSEKQLGKIIDSFRLEIY